MRPRFLLKLFAPDGYMSSTLEVKIVGSMLMRCGTGDGCDVKPQNQFSQALKLNGSRNTNRDRGSRG